ncbi:MAG: hypothetical protein CSYNP_03192 [Syntrophus sp. SKADARSKE-3]|nr:hypothetical protein [Syntrophus sp. SKADARSKE-3]
MLMMHINVKLFATLRQWHSDVGELEVALGATVGDVIRAIGIPEKDVKLIFINGRHGLPDTELAEGDTLALFPPIGGG